MKQLLILLASLCVPGSQTGAAEKPNIIFILADDLGWRDVGCFGSTFHETPNIDRLAARGVKFTQAYAASPLCSPTRSSILTGQYPARIGITAPACHLPQVQLEKRLVAGKQPNVKVLNADSLTRLKPDYFTLAEALTRGGLRDGAFRQVAPRPQPAAEPGRPLRAEGPGLRLRLPAHAQPPPGPGGGYLAPWKFIKDPGITGQPGEHIEDRMSAEAAKFIREHKDRPFYVNYWAYSVHSPWNARRDYIEHFKPKADEKNPQHNPLYAAMVREPGRRRGPPARRGGRGRASPTARSSCSSPTTAAGPTRRKPPTPKGFEDMPATSNLPAAQRQGLALRRRHARAVHRRLARQDPSPARPTTRCCRAWTCYPTLLAMCGLKPHADVKLDGVDQTPTLLGQGAVRDRVFCHFPHGGAEAGREHPRLPARHLRAPGRLEADPLLRRQRRRQRPLRAVQPQGRRRRDEEPRRRQAGTRRAN